ncbi:MAG: Fe-S-cluster-containing dehydrogenase component [Kiritimatiellia bacterium]|jgi:Fe-S-cluster-containing dehydrogenase component
MNYGFLIDNSSCIGCHACSTACKSENEVPLGVYRTWVKYTETGAYPDVRRHFQVTRCNHCSNAPCVRICPTAAMFQRPDGIIDFNNDYCIGCAGCIQACPYDSIHFDPVSHTASKCNFCAHRVDNGLEPACVVVCPAHAILAGDLDDPNAEISRVLAKKSVTVRKPEQGTSPNLFYVDGHDHAMHPTAVEAPSNMSFTDVLNLQPGKPVQLGGAQPQRSQPQGLPSKGAVHLGARDAGHMVQVGYNAQHKHHWHWPIPAYLVTKHIAGGSFACMSLAVLLGLDFSPQAFVGIGAVGLAMLGITLMLLMYDLQRPDRFFFMLVRPQWSSWIARAAWILSAFSAVAGAWWAIELGGWMLGFEIPALLRYGLAVTTLPIAVLAAVYTAFLFAQAEGRDLWQSSHLAPLMALHAVIFGAATLAVVGPWVHIAQPTLVVALILSALLTVVADLFLPHSSEVARQGNYLFTKGTYRKHWWLGGLALGHILPLILASFGNPAAALVCVVVLAMGHYYYGYGLVMAAQDVPNS